MKKIVSLLLSLLMIFAACTAMADTVVTVQPGDELTMEVSIESASGKSAKIGIKTNDAPVTFVGATGGNVNDTVPPQEFNDYFDIVNIDDVNFTPDGSNLSGPLEAVRELEDGLIGKLTFKVNANAEPGVEYTVEAYKKSGSVTVVGSVTFMVEKVVVSDRIPGDVNDDGEVDPMDALLLDRYLADWDVTINLSNADVNGDGEVDPMDALTLDRYLADWDVTLI